MTEKISRAERERFYELLPCESIYPISKELIDEIIDKSDIIVIKKGEPLIAEGDCNKDVYILLDGIMRSWHWDGDTEKTVYFGNAGTLCVCYHCYLMNKTAPSTIEACNDCRVLLIRKSVYNNLLTGNFEFALYIVGNLQMQSLFYEKMYSTFNGTAYERYLSMCKHRPEIVKEVPLKTIASYLGITPTYLSRIRKKIFSELF